MPHHEFPIDTLIIIYIVIFVMFGIGRFMPNKVGHKVGRLLQIPFFIVAFIPIIGTVIILVVDFIKSL